MSSINTDPVLITNILDRLERPATNEYIVAFGPDGKQFHANYNGYSANYLPSKPLAELAGCDIKKIVWASFGSKPDSWFFAYEFKNGATTFRLGEGVPIALREYVDRFGKPTDLDGTLRVQLGHDDSFTVWSKTSWACHNVPIELRVLLSNWSSDTRNGNDITMGALKKGNLINVQWSKDGSFFVQAANKAYAKRFNSAVMQDAWKNLWPGLPWYKAGPEHIAELAHVAINAHGAIGETFAFMKNQLPGKEAPFIARIGGGPVQARLPTFDYSLRLIDSARQYSTFRYAVCTQSGRPHGPSQDQWELQLKKGQRVKVLEDAGNDWYIVADERGSKGYAHKSWLDFNPKRHQAAKDPAAAWRRFDDDVKEMLSRPISNFPAMRRYVDICARQGCRLAKGDKESVGICAHDFRILLQGSGRYSLEWLKEARNMWHPDRFARLCVPEHAGLLKVKAQQLFVLYGVLMEDF